LKKGEPMMKGEITMKRLFSIICLLLVFSLIFAGCVQKKESGSAGEGEEQTKGKFDGMTSKEIWEQVEDQFFALTIPDYDVDLPAYELLPLYELTALLERIDQIGGFSATVVLEKENYTVLEIQPRASGWLEGEEPSYVLYGKEYYADGNGLNGNKDTHYGCSLFVYQNDTLITLPQACERGIVPEAALPEITENSWYFCLKSEGPPVPPERPKKDSSVGKLMDT